MVRSTSPARTTSRFILIEQPPPSADPKINTLLAKIQSERRNLEGAKAVVRAVEASSRNEAVIQQARNEVRAAQASIKFLEDELAKLQVGSPAGQRSPYGDGRPGSGSGAPGLGAPGGPGTGGYGGPQAPSTGQDTFRTGNGMVSPSPRPRVGGEERPLPPPPPGETAQPGAEPAKPGQKNYTQLGEYNQSRPPNPS